MSQIKDSGHWEHPLVHLPVLRKDRSYPAAAAAVVVDQVRAGDRVRLGSVAAFRARELIATLRRDPVSGGRTTVGDPFRHGAVVCAFSGDAS